MVCVNPFMLIAAWEVWDGFWSEILVKSFFMVYMYACNRNFPNPFLIAVRVMMRKNIEKEV